MTAPAFASLAVAGGNPPIVNPNVVSYITTEGTGSRLHLINRPSLLVSLSATAAAAALGFSIVASPSDLAGASGPTLISVTRSGAAQQTLINPDVISYVQPTADDGAILHLLAASGAPALATDASVSTIAGLLDTAKVVLLNRKGAAEPSLITRDQVVSVIPFVNGHDGARGAMLALRDGNRFETASDVTEVLAALTAS